MSKKNKQQGFTLTEIVIVILVLGVMSLAITNVIDLMTRGYRDTVERQEAMHEASFVLEKMSREIRNAVPNSLNINGKCLEFYPIEFTGHYDYIDVPDAVHNAYKLDFVLLNNGSNWPDLDTNGFRFTINPSDINDLTTGGTSLAFPESDPGIVKYDLVLNGVNPLHYRLFLKDLLLSQSIGNRLYIYNDQVSYCFEGDQLTRTEGNSGTPVVIANDIDEDESGFRFEEVALSRSSLVHIDLVLRGAFSQGAQVVFSQNVQVLNVP